jgi:glycine/D-amino acid oxidase-like deaminating enzyme
MAKPVTVIVGAGIVGCLVARELAAADPAASITVLDRDAIGAGATRRSAGLHLPRGATDRTKRMSAVSHAYYADLVRRRPGLPIYPIGATEISAGSAPRRIAGCHYADVYRLTQALAAELRPRVRFTEGVAVTGLAAAPGGGGGGGGVTVSVSTGKPIIADSVVLAPGPWLSDPAWRDLLAPLGLRVKKVVALHIGQRPGPADEAVIYPDDDAFLLPLADRGHWLFSYTCQEWDVDPDALTGGLSADTLDAARECLRRCSPRLADACDGGRDGGFNGGFNGGREFCDAYSADREPLVRALDGAGRMVFAGAANGSGYRLAPAIAAEAVALLQARPAQLSKGVTGDPQYV